MKFGKHILAERIPGWFGYYLDYKALKKIISSVNAEHAVPVDNPEIRQIRTAMSPLNAFQAASGPLQPLWEPSQVLADAPSPLSTAIAANNTGDYDRGPDFQAKKAAFFFKLQRELDKINAFYLQREAELKLRMIALLRKRQAAANRILVDGDDRETVKDHVEWRAVIEGFTLLQNDLLKLQQFIDINALGFRKILKKWDKRSKSTTKELYIRRQVEVQPVFNRQLITEFSDTVTACLLNLTDPTVPISSTLLGELSKDDSVLSEELSREPLTRSRVFLDLEDATRRAVADNDAAAVQQALLTANELASSAPDGKTFVARILWRSAIDAEPPLADLILDSPNSPCDFKFIDDINGRTCMHEAAAAGALRLIDMCINKGVEVNRQDQYGRTALHYAVIGGHVGGVDRLIAANADPSIRDMDNFSCHYYAVVYGRLDCVRVLLKVGIVGADTNARDDGINLLALACLHGHVDIVLLLLQQGARQLPNSNGEYPIHLAAGAGHAEVCRLLSIRSKETLDIPDKFNEWTPLFHAVRNGRAAVVKVLLEAGSNSQATDELGRIPIFYAGWYGHVECVDLLLSAAQQQNPAAKGAPQESIRTPQEDLALGDIDNDAIPSLFLPPPIMPFRIYGHNYLDKQYLVQITLGRPHSQFNVRKPEPPVKITAWTTDYPVGTPNPRPQSLMKMVMTSRSDQSAIPVSLTVPLSESRDVVTFRVQDLSELSLEFSFYPKFGSKAIGRAAVLSSAFENIKDSKDFSLAILDHRLHIVGQVIFEACIIRPFDGVTLQFGGVVETYWKSSSQHMDRGTPNVIASDPLDSTQTSPSTQSAVMKPSGSMTISSLSNDFITVVVQGTRDYIPVVYSEWNIPVDGLDVGVADVTASQFESIALQAGQSLNSSELGSTRSLQEWAELTRSVMVPLEKLLTTLPPDVGIQLHVAFPNRAIRESNGLGHCLDLNTYVESILLAIYRTAGSHSRRRISFLSFSPSVCTALNWKQPNYPVFFASHCGLPEQERSKWRPPRPEPETDRRCTSVSAAVEFARANNLLGVFLNANLLVKVPVLVQGVKDLNLVLGTFGTSQEITTLQAPGHPMGHPDATWVNGVVSFVDNTNLAEQ